VASVKKIIIVNGEQSSATILYRSYAAERCLKKLGLVVDVHEVDNLNNVSLKGVTACLFIRTPLTPAVGVFIEKLKSLNITILSDFDDLIFRPDILHLIDGINYLAETERQQFIERVSQFQEMIKRAEVVIVTTFPLAEEALRYNKNVMVIKNYPLPETRNLCFDIKKKNSDKFVIGYYSGTLTHQRDFRQCSSALVELMNKWDRVELRIVGEMKIEEFDEFEPVKARITRIPLMDYKNMLMDLRACDLNIAPLEINNVFCQCKSELKYFDAALMCVPTLASPTKPFKATIRHGVNGYLAETLQEWFDCLEEVLKNKHLAYQVGMNARRHALSFFGEAAQINDYRNLMRFVASLN
jgi:glycosyltransferase involved in cell wall biosynthesis